MKDKCKDEIYQIISDYPSGIFLGKVKSKSECYYEDNSVFSDALYELQEENKIAKDWCGKLYKV